MGGGEQDEGHPGRAQAVREIHVMASVGWIDLRRRHVNESVAQELDNSMIGATWTDETLSHSKASLPLFRRRGLSVRMVIALSMAKVTVCYRAGKSVYITMVCGASPNGTRVTGEPPSDSIQRDD
jgi:hypothetical protein